MMRRECPICGKPTSPVFRPFCSKRCADIDLGQWLDGRYRVPTEEGPSDGGGWGREEDENGR